MGQRPSDPVLLDHLAQRFIELDWSTKKLIREIMLTRTYRGSTLPHDSETVIHDPENLWLARASRRRLDAEVLRDSMLYVAGTLDMKEGGLTIRKITQYDLGYKFNTQRRSVYVPAFRNSLMEIFEVFDFANPNLVVGHRNSSTLPTQALYLMNNPDVIECARRSAERLLDESLPDESARIELAYQRFLGRSPSPIESNAALAYIDEMQQDVNKPIDAWASFCHALIASLEFR